MIEWVYAESDHATAAKLLIAVESLASSQGIIGERLHDVYLIMSKLKETDFPEELQDSFLEIRPNWRLILEMSRLQKSPKG